MKTNLSKCWSNTDNSHIVHISKELENSKIWSFGVARNINGRDFTRHLTRGTLTGGGDFTGDFTRHFTEDFTGDWTEDFTGDFTGNIIGRNFFLIPWDLTNLQERVVYLYYTISFS